VSRIITAMVVGFQVLNLVLMFLLGGIRESDSIFPVLIEFWILITAILGIAWFIVINQKKLRSVKLFLFSFGLLWINLFLNDYVILPDGLSLLNFSLICGGPLFIFIIGFLISFYGDKSLELIGVSSLLIVWVMYFETFSRASQISAWLASSGKVSLPDVHAWAFAGICLAPIVLLVSLFAFFISALSLFLKEYHKTI
jgi:hypothetical protein